MSLPALAVILPTLLETTLLTVMSLLVPFACSVTLPLPPAVMFASMVSLPAAFRLTLPLAAVVIAPVVLRSPVLSTTILPPFWLMPVMAKGLAVLTNSISPVPLFVAFKL